MSVLSNINNRLPKPSVRPGTVPARKPFARFGPISVTRRGHPSWASVTLRARATQTAAAWHARPGPWLIVLSEHARLSLSCAGSILHGEPCESRLSAATANPALRRVGGAARYMRAGRLVVRLSGTMEVAGRGWRQPASAGDGRSLDTAPTAACSQDGCDSRASPRSRPRRRWSNRVVRELGSWITSRSASGCRAP